MSYRAIADQVVVPVRKDQDLPLFKWVFCLAPHRCSRIDVRLVTEISEPIAQS